MPGEAPRAAAAEAAVSSSQRQLASELARQSGLEVISLKDNDCLLFSRGDILKMFCPRSKRVLMGTPKDRMVIGEILLVFEHDLKPLRRPSGRYDFADLIVAAPIANFPAAGLTMHSGLVDGVIDPRFIERLRALFDALPSDRIGWQRTFGADFLNLPFMARFTKVVGYLRESVKFADPVRDDIRITVSISDPRRLKR